jgi:hypothetical protein
LLRGRINEISAEKKKFGLSQKKALQIKKPGGEARKN